MMFIFDVPSERETSLLHRATLYQHLVPCQGAP